MKALDKAVADLSRAIEMEPGFSQVYHIRSTVYRDMGKAELSAKDAKKTKLLMNSK